MGGVDGAGLLRSATCRCRCLLRVLWICWLSRSSTCWLVWNGRCRSVSTGARWFGNVGLLAGVRTVARGCGLSGGRSKGPRRTGVNGPEAAVVLRGVGHYQPTALRALPPCASSPSGIPALYGWEVTGRPRLPPDGGPLGNGGCVQRPGRMLPPLSSRGTHTGTTSCFRKPFRTRTRSATSGS